MIHASISGADIYVDGRFRGKSPLLLQNLPSGVGITVVARTATREGKTDISLKSGELRNVVIPMKELTGNLAILSNVQNVDVYLDGKDQGPLNQGIFRNLPIGEKKLELVGKYLYFSTMVTIPSDNTASVNAQVLPVGTIKIVAPQGVQIRIHGRRFSVNGNGSSVFRHVPAGTYNLTASGEGYYETSASFTVTQGAQSNWNPYVTGRLVFNVTPADSVCLLDGRRVNAQGQIEGLVPGEYSVKMSRPGYYGVQTNVLVRAGREKTIDETLTSFAPGAIVLPRYGVPVRLVVDGKSETGIALSNGKVQYLGIPSGYPATVRFVVPAALYANVPAQSVTVKPGGVVRLTIPAGRLSVPWIPPNERLDIGGIAFAGDGASDFTSALLPAGRYPISVSGDYPFEGQADVVSGKTMTVPGYAQTLRWSMSNRIAADQQALHAKNPRTVWGAALLGGGLLSAGAAVISYVLGTEAMQSYNSATDSSTVQT